MVSLRYSLTQCLPIAARCTGHPAAVVGQQRRGEHRCHRVRPRRCVVRCVLVYDTQGPSSCRLRGCTEDGGSILCWNVLSWMLTHLIIHYIRQQSRHWLQRKSVAAIQRPKTPSPVPCPPQSKIQCTHDPNMGITFPPSHQRYELRMLTSQVRERTGVGELIAVPRVQQPSNLNPELVSPRRHFTGMMSCRRCPGRAAISSSTCCHRTKTTKILGKLSLTC